MRRIIIIGTALAVLGVAAVAVASSINTYTAKISFSPTKGGSAKKPVVVSFTTDFTANGTNGNRTAPLTDVKTTIYGLKVNSKGFPTCTLAQISAAKNDTGCPPKALAATGYITAVIGPTNDQSSGASGTLPCDPLLHVWNGGNGKLVFFFVDQAPNHQCANGALTTGSVPPYPGTISYSGKNLVQDTPVPSYVSFPLAGIEGSLESLHLNWLKQSTVVKGKKVFDITSVGCAKGNKRPFSVTFKANEPNQPTETDTVNGSAKCTK